MEQLTGGRSCEMTKGPSHEASKHLLMPGALLYTRSPTSKFAASSDSFESLDEECLEASDFLTKWVWQESMLPRSEMNWVKGAHT